MKDKNLSRREALKIGLVATGVAATGIGSGALSALWHSGANNASPSPASSPLAKAGEEFIPSPPSPRFLVLGPPRATHVHVGQELVVALSRKVPATLLANRFSITLDDAKFHGFSLSQPTALVEAQLAAIRSFLAAPLPPGALVASCASGDLSVPAVELLTQNGFTVVYVDLADRLELLGSFLSFKKHRHYSQPSAMPPILPAETISFNREWADELTAELSHFYDLRGRFGGYTLESARHGQTWDTPGTALHALVAESTAGLPDSRPPPTWLRSKEAEAPRPFRELLDNNDQRFSLWSHKLAHKRVGGGEALA
jgi:hypothetical protein